MFGIGLPLSVERGSKEVSSNRRLPPVQPRPFNSMTPPRAAARRTRRRQTEPAAAPGARRVAAPRRAWTCSAPARRGAPGRRRVLFAGVHRQAGEIGHPSRLSSRREGILLSGRAGAPNVSCRFGSGQNFLDDAPMHIGQPEIAARIAIGELLVVETE